MKLNLKALTLALVLGTITVTAATVKVFAQDEKPPQTEKQDEKSEYKKPEPAHWLTVPESKIKLGFAKEWESPDLKGSDMIQSATPDAGVRISAYVAKQNSEDGTTSKFQTLEEAYKALKGLLESHYKGLELTDPKASRECHGLKVLDTGGHAKLEDGTAVDVAVDLIQDEGQIIVVLIVGAHEAMDKHAADIILAQESYQKDKADGDKDKDKDK